MSNKHKRQPVPSRRRTFEWTDAIDAIVQAMVKGLVDGFLWWISRGGHF